MFSNHSYFYISYSTEIIHKSNGFQNGAPYFQNAATVLNYQAYLMCMQTKGCKG